MEELPADRARARRWAPWVALLVVGLVHLRALSGQLVYDDLLLVARNPLITDATNLSAFLGSSHFEFLGPADEHTIPYWRPLTSFALALVHHVGGGDPRAFHAASILAHLAASFAVYRVARRLGFAELPAAGALLLFGLHPVHVESVAWISALGDPLFGCASLLAVDAFLGWRGRAGAKPAVLAPVLFLVALLAKELALATLPLVLVLDLTWRRARRSESVRARDYAGFALALLIYWAARAVVFGGPLAGFVGSPTEFEAGLGRTLLLVVELVGGSLELLVWPADLALFHAVRPRIPYLDLAFALEALLAAGFAVALLVLVRRGAWRAAGLLLAIPAAMLPVFVRARSLGAFPLAERFLYLPVLGFALLLLLAGARLPRRAGFALVLLLAVAYGARTFVRIGDWHDEPALFRSAARVEPDCPYVQWGLGRALLGAYQASAEPAYLEEAQAAFQRASDLVSQERAGDETIFATEHDDVQARLGLAWVELLAAEATDPPDYRPARLLFQAVVQDHPENGDAYAGLGAAFHFEGDLAGAERAFGEALSRDPRDPEALHNLARVLEDAGRPEEARARYLAAHELRPRDPREVLALARLAARPGAQDPRVDEWFALARELAPSDPEVSRLAGLRAANAGELEAALSSFDAALELDTSFGPALLERAKANLALGRNEAGLADLERAVYLLPESFEARYNLGALRLAVRDPRARDTLIEAFSLRARPEELQRLRPSFAQVFADDLDALLAFARADHARGERAAAGDWLARAALVAGDDPALRARVDGLQRELRAAER